ncbi:MaoC/PaaZ C-terminal domain-containing protein [Tomitella gaofuii]|uniref:MaoC/PaaZ C-terminal domain-containing protein n=1 Tax=Tomitella gaofuii TaxID=2760083 RepID=UPI0015FCEECD|nr:MaoC/PaaZ C-terminal domain-containing protein [Tomitella gaofuii]
MPLTSEMAGLRGPAATDTVEDRWVMNYAASTGDTNPVYFDNRGAAALPAHPAYLSHLEWDAIALLHEKHLGALTPEERVRGVHSFNATRLHRAVRAGDTLSSSAQVVGVEKRRAGGRMTLRIDTVDAAGAPVATSHTTTVFLGVDAQGETASAPTALDTGGSAAAPAAPVRTEDITIGPLAPYVFSECARDYGVIHTDIRVATEAGFPGLILHGTGTIAYALSALTNGEAGGDPTRVHGFQARLTGMVLCPSVMTLRVFGTQDDAPHADADSPAACDSPRTIRFDVLADTGERAISDGVLLLGAGR